MDAVEQVTVHFRVVSATELPRTNFIGSIDPYFRVYLDGNILGETRHFKNQQEPVWEEDLFFDADRNDDGCLCGVLRLELYDENRTRQDEHVGSVEIDLAELPPETFDPDAVQQIEFYDYDISYKDAKRGEKLSRQGRSPHVTVAFLGAIPSWSAMAARLDGWEEEVGLLADEDSKQLYVPLPGGEGAGLYGGIQYLLPRAVHFKLVTVSKHHAGLHLDFKCSKARSLCVERVTYHTHRRRLLKGLRVYAEATLTNLPLGTDLRKLQLTATNRRAAVSYKLPDTLELAGFPADVIGSSGLSYKRVSRAMPGALLDAPTGGVFVPVGKAPPYNAMLHLDFNEGGGGSDGGASGGMSGRRLTASVAGGGQRAALRVLTLMSRSEAKGREFVYDFITAGCETTTTSTECRRRGVKILGGEYRYTCSSELPGVFDDQRPELYDTAALVAFALEAQPITSCRFLELFEPPPEDEPEDEGGLLDAFDPDNMPHSMGSMAVMVATKGGKMVGKAVDQLGRAVDQLGHMVAGMGIAGAGGEDAAANGDRAGGGGGAAVLKVIKAPLKLFRGGGGSGKDAAEGGSGSGGGDRRGKGQPDGGGGRDGDSGRGTQDGDESSVGGRSAGAGGGGGGSGRDRGGGGGFTSGGASARDRVADTWSGRERAGGGGASGSGRERGAGAGAPSGGGGRERPGAANGGAGFRAGAPQPSYNSSRGGYDEDDEDEESDGA